MEEQVRKLGDIYSMGYLFSGYKENKILQLTTAWMEAEDTGLNELSEAHKDDRFQVYGKLSTHLRMIE